MNADSVYKAFHIHFPSVEAAVLFKELDKTLTPLFRISEKWGREIEDYLNDNDKEIEDFKEDKKDCVLQKSIIIKY